MMKMLLRLFQMFSMHETCWDPEFEPSVEELDRGLSMRYGDSLSLLSLVSSYLGDFPIQPSTWQVEVTSGSTGSSHVPQYTRIRRMHSLSMCPSSNYGGLQ